MWSVIENQMKKFLIWYNLERQSWTNEYRFGKFTKTRKKNSHNGNSIQICTQCTSHEIVVGKFQKENIQYMNKFTVTTGNKDTVELNRLTRAIALHDIWNRQYHNTVSSMFQKYKSLDDWSQDELMKVALLRTEKMVCWVIIRMERLQKWAISLVLCRLWSEILNFGNCNCWNHCK